MSSPLVSVVMPCHNAAPYLEEAVASVFAQTLDDVELILVDDGSTDGSLEIQDRLATEHPGRITLIRQQNQGPYPARNAGLAQARGGFIAFLDADDWWRKDFLERCHAVLSDHPDAVLAYCGWQNQGNSPNGTEPHVPPELDPQDTERLLRGCPWPIHAALVRRDALDAVGGFSTYRFSSMDYDLWLKLIALGQPLVRVPEVLAFYRWRHSGQISHNRWKQTLNAVEVRRRFVAAHPERFSGLSRNQIRDLVYAPLVTNGYQAFWQRDLYTARQLFRQALLRGQWQARDLKYFVPALLPHPWFATLVKALE